MINLNLGDSNFQVIKFNQYDKNYTFQIKLNNYTFKTGDTVKIEWIINDVTAIIQTDYITRQDNILTIKLLREVTLNSGIGYFNVVIDNTTDNSRRATFKSEFEVVSNSIDEETVSSQLIQTALEKLREEEVNANEVLNNLLKAIADGNISNKLDKTGDTMKGKLTMANNIPINGAGTDKGYNIAILNASNQLWIGHDEVPLFLQSKETPRVKIGTNATTYYLYHSGNKETLVSNIKSILLDTFYPIGSIKLTAGNTNPSTTLGGTWQIVGQGKAIVGVGTGTDKNGVTKTFSAGSNDGEYQHTMTVNEMPSHSHPQNVTAGSGGSGSRIDYNADGNGNPFSQGINTNSTGGGQAFNITQPTFGLYIWKRTA